MLGTITILLACQLAGEIIVRMAGLPLPGPVVGMLILLIGLLIKKGVPAEMEASTSGLLRNLSLLFVPSGVGIVTNLNFLADEWAPILGAVLVGTLVTIGVTGWVLQALSPPSGPPS
jgi:holin-like protein